MEELRKRVPVDKLHIHPGNRRAVEEHFGMNEFEHMFYRIVYRSDNPKDVRKVKKAFRERIDINPIIATRGGTIISGTFNWVVAKELGRKTVPVFYVDVDDSEAMRVMIMLNKSVY